MLYIMYISFSISYVRFPKISDHFADYDDFGSKLLVDGKDVDESQCEHHVVDRHQGPAELVGLLEHSGLTKKNMHTHM